MYLLWRKRSTAQTAVEEPVDVLTNYTLTAEEVVAGKTAAQFILKTDWALCLNRAGKPNAGLSRRSRRSRRSRSSCGSGFKL